jgi:general secretion pathway protein G
MTPRHPKLHWRAVLRDLGLTVAASGALILTVTVLLWLLPLLLFGHVNLAPPKQEAAENGVRNLRLALNLFHQRHQRYPSTEESLQLLVDRHYLEQRPLDPWGNPYGYELREGQPVVWSYGADGVPGGEGPDADISSPDPGTHQ